MTKQLILGIETSCDETCAAIVANGRNLISNTIYTQIDTHKRFGGVVPEIASRSHIEKIDEVVHTALREAGVKLQDITAVAATNGPGLVGALLVGLNYAKGLAYGAGLPLIPINHIEGHICANYIANHDFAPPYVALVVSGGHTSFIEVNSYTEYNLLGSTTDDAAGEAFDKAARMLGLPYPGGVEIEKLAKSGDPSAIRFPRAVTENPLDCSFSGLKSNLYQYLQKNKEYNAADVAASFQDAIADVLAERALRAVKITDAKAFALCGGVAANTRVRTKVQEACASVGVSLQVPPISLCTDNAAMIAAAGFYRLDCVSNWLAVNAVPNLAL
ncbi:MAG: tRNA (adenosine(37)-N6)-threonylcarbamoyltransferase complex transferase subunit TsaD [Defluviitaleaceae bacterium]|nr:tRNA (adenosine(37)-N6)-threonylcarbamoyltransferase complex transferase subunit TsaD [Defluviitaleaceae bacterium]